MSEKEKINQEETTQKLNFKSKFNEMRIMRI